MMHNSGSAVKGAEGVPKRQRRNERSGTRNIAAEDCVAKRSCFQHQPYKKTFIFFYSVILSSIYEYQFNCLHFRRCYLDSFIFYHERKNFRTEKDSGSSWKNCSKSTDFIRGKPKPYDSCGTSAHIDSHEILCRDNCMRLRNSGSLHCSE